IGQETVRFHDPLEFVTVGTLDVVGMIHGSQNPKRLCDQQRVSVLTQLERLVRTGPIHVRLPRAVPGGPAHVVLKIEGGITISSGTGALGQYVRPAARTGRLGERRGSRSQPGADVRATLRRVPLRSSAR